MERGEVMSCLPGLLLGSTIVPGAEDEALDQSAKLESFLASVEARAFRIAQVGIQDVEAALDIVQEAMIQLVKKYAHRPDKEWPPLFYRILQNRIRDWQRKKTVRAKVMAWLPRLGPEDELRDPVQQAPDPQGIDPGREAMMDEAMEALAVALRDLPTRQREAFMLRNFEGLDVAGTAKAMACSEGSVKTHYSRAVHALRQRLGPHWGSEE